MIELIAKVIGVIAVVAGFIGCYIAVLIRKEERDSGRGTGAPASGG
jgi:hypothetical protein